MILSRRVLSGAELNRPLLLCGVDYKELWKVEELVLGELVLLQGVVS